MAAPVGVKLTVKSECFLSGAPEELRAAIREQLTVDNPKYLAAQRYSRWVGTQIKPKLYFYREQGSDLVFPRGFGNRAVLLCRRLLGGDPVFGFCTNEEYNDFMRGVTGFEKDLARQGTVLVKLYFSVTKEEQAKRFERRKTDPLRQWKLSEIDVQAQNRWDDFTRQKYEMLKRTHTNIAPWTIIRSNNKHEARLNAMKIILNAVPYDRGNKELDYVPEPDVVISGAREKELMDAQLLKLGRFIG